MWGALAGLAGTVFSANKASKEARTNRNFQEQMSNTAYRRSMSDMKAAGLNPILAAKNGGASTPGGSLAQVPDFGQSFSSALQATASQQQADTSERKVDQEIQNLIEEKNLTEEQANVVRKTADKINSEITKIQNETEGIELKNQIQRIVSKFVHDNPQAELWKQYGISGQVIENDLLKIFEDAFQSNSFSGRNTGGGSPHSARQAQ